MDAVVGSRRTSATPAMIGAAASLALRRSHHLSGWSISAYTNTYNISDFPGLRIRRSKQRIYDSAPRGE
jgi:hypothetical protein